MAGQLRAGTVGHNAFRTDFGMAFGGFKQSGIGREGGREGLLPFLETKSVILDAPPARYRGLMTTSRAEVMSRAIGRDPTASVSGRTETAESKAVKWPHWAKWLCLRCSLIPQELGWLARMGMVGRPLDRRLMTRRGKVRITVDTERCQGHGRCFAVAPDLYPLNEDGYSAVATADVPPGSEPAAEAGVNACPERAISVAQRMRSERSILSPAASLSISYESHTKRDILYRQDDVGAVASSQEVVLAGCKCPQAGRRAVSIKMNADCFIDGAWRPIDRYGLHQVINPTTEEPIGAVVAGTAEDVDRAVIAARGALPGWSGRPVNERAEAVNGCLHLMDERRGEFAELVCLELGAPLKAADMIQVGLPIYELACVADVASTFEFEEVVGNSMVLRAPIGVVGAITPWNFPLHQITAKIAPALVAGCTVVLKPSEVTPLSALKLIELMAEVGFPPGVVNLVPGTGPVVGEAIAAHPCIDMVSFTGSTRAGKRVSELAAGNVKRVALELGGKSANVLLDDADFERAVKLGVRGAFSNSGQACSALTRMLVPRSGLRAVEELAVEEASEYRLGAPFDPQTRLGPLVSDIQRERVRSYIRAGDESGARRLCGGPEAPVGLDRGYFVQPTIFSDVTSTSRIAQEEIFGPVLSILPYDSEEEAVAIANDSAYGLAAAVWAGDKAHAVEVARRLRVGQVEINGGRFNAVAPFGGWKQSGNGREGGKYGLSEYLELTALQM